MKNQQADTISREKPLRLFIALAVDDAVKDNLATWQRRLKPVFDHGEVSWTNPIGVHLTLKFLGNTPPERVNDIVAALTSRLTGYGPVNLHACGTGVFPHPAKPRVLFARTIVTDGDLAGIAGAVEDGCVELGYESDNRAFKPHLTLGRMKRMNHKRVSRLELADDTPDFGIWTASEVVLYQSKLTPAGARYQALHQWQLDSSLNHG